MSTRKNAAKEYAEKLSFWAIWAYGAFWLGMHMWSKVANVLS